MTRRLTSPRRRQGWRRRVLGLVVLALSAVVGCGDGLPTDPAETRLVEVVIEVCDGRPSYVQQHQDDYRVYCPWGARVIERRR
jgi:hypothetical protein